METQKVTTSDLTMDILLAMEDLWNAELGKHSNTIYVTFDNSQQFCITFTEI